MLETNTPWHNFKDGDVRNLMTPRYFKSTKFDAPTRDEVKTTISQPGTPTDIYLLNAQADLQPVVTERKTTCCVWEKTSLPGIVGNNQCQEYLKETVKLHPPPFLQISFWVTHYTTLKNWSPTLRNFILILLPTVKLLTKWKILFPIVNNKLFDCLLIFFKNCNKYQQKYKKNVVNCILL